MEQTIIKESLLFAINNLHYGDKLDEAVSIYKKLTGIGEGNEQTN